MQITASCEASECLDPTGPKLVGGGTAKQAGPDAAPPVLAALPLFLLIIGGLACLTALTRYSRYLRSSSSLLAGTRPSSSSGGLSSSNGSNQGADALAAIGAGQGDKAGATSLKGIVGIPQGPFLTNDIGSPRIITKRPGEFRQIQQLSFEDIRADVRVLRSWREIISSPLPHGKLLQQQQSPTGDAEFVSAAAAPAVARFDAGNAKDVENGKDPLPRSDAVFNGVNVVATTTAAANVAAGKSPADLGLYAVRASSSGGSSKVSNNTSSRWRPVLLGVSGHVFSREVLGVMGPSGGGKSTLLMKLCGSLGGRGADWRSSGVVCLDGVVAPPALLTAVTALVPQDDTLMRSLTVEECIRYSAALRLDPDLPPSKVAAEIEAVMSTLGLTHIRHNTVLSGTGVSGVSGGQRRRVAIGMELVINPQVLVLDEPLSGLDSFTALQLMRTLQAVAASGRVVALSLHQPSPALFSALDTAMLLAGGTMVYSGTPSAAAAALEGLGCPVPEGMTVAEHLLHVVSDPHSLEVVVAAATRQQQNHQLEYGQQEQQQQQAGPVAEEQQQGRVTKDSLAPDQEQQQQQQGFVAAAPGQPKTGCSVVVASPRESVASGGFSTFGSGNYAQYFPRASHTGGVSRFSATGGIGSAKNSSCGTSKAAREALGMPKQRRPFDRQIAVLFWRGLLDMLRNPLLTAFHAVGALVLGILVGVIFYQVQNDTSGAQNRVGAIFFALCLLAFTSVTSVDLVQAESAAASREMQRKYYSPLAYALTKLVLDGLLLRALPALLFGIPFYYLMGLNPAAVHVVVFLFVLMGLTAAVGALALAFASALDSPGKTILVMNLVLLLGVLFGGFLANKASIPVWLRWISWLSVFRYAWEALVINELAGLDLFLSAPGVALSLPVRGEVFLEIIGVQWRLYMVDVVVLVAMYLACCVFVLFVLGWRNRQRKE
eukprot:GHRR01000820.1.p1 GENE.GHRR01000820.1~~GHRR01000820.1.p1  ORF type:complete len:943 (+),score=354.31 GHRR01000820.1:2184-5012(+)